MSPFFNMNCNKDKAQPHAKFYPCHSVSRVQEGRKRGRLHWGKRVNSRQLEKGCGKSRERERERPKEWGHIKSNRTQARLYPACLSRSLRPHRKLPTPLAFTHLPSRTTLFTLTHSPTGCAESDQRGWLGPCGEWMSSWKGWLESCYSALCCSAVSTLIVIDYSFFFWKFWCTL